MLFAPPFWPSAFLCLVVFFFCFVNDCKLVPLQDTFRSSQPCVLLSKDCCIVCTLTSIGAWFSRCKTRSMVFPICNRCRFSLVMMGTVYRFPCVGIGISLGPSVLGCWFHVSVRHVLHCQTEYASCQLFLVTAFVAAYLVVLPPSGSFESGFFKLQSLCWCHCVVGQGCG